MVFYSFNVKISKCHLKHRAFFMRRVVVPEIGNSKNWTVWLGGPRMELGLPRSKLGGPRSQLGGPWSQLGGKERSVPGM